MFIVFHIKLPVCLFVTGCTFCCLVTHLWIHGMYLCIYVCIYVCMYVCRYVRMHVCTYVCMYVSMYVCMYSYVCIMYVCMHVGTYVCMYVCTYVCFINLIHVDNCKYTGFHNPRSCQTFLYKTTPMHNSDKGFSR
jgi:nuclear pore complex protein Nup62